MLLRPSGLTAEQIRKKLSFPRLVNLGLTSGILRLFRNWQQLLLRLHFYFVLTMCQLHRLRQFFPQAVRGQQAYALCVDAQIPKLVLICALLHENSQLVEDGPIVQLLESVEFAVKCDSFSRKPGARLKQQTFKSPVAVDESHVAKIVLVLHTHRAGEVTEFRF